MKKAQRRQLSKRKLLIPVVLLVFLFSIIKVGTALASADSLVITEAKISDKSPTAQVNSFSFEDGKITNNITYHSVGDSVTYEIKVKNNDDTSYTIKSISDNNENKYISYIYDGYEGTKLNSKEEKTFEITEKYVQENMNISNRTQENSVVITFTVEDENGNEIDKTVPINTPDNPKTGDNVRAYITLSIISLIILTVLLRKRTAYVSLNKAKRIRRKSKHSGKGFKFFGLFIVAALILPTISKAEANYALSLTIENKVSLKDKLVVSYTINGNNYEKVVNYNEKVDMEDPEIDGYEFKGWKDENEQDFDLDSPILDDAKITAKLNTLVYTIDYDLAGGTLENENPEEYTIESDDIILNKPTKEGYTFTGWTGTDLANKTTDVTISSGSVGSRQYTANWEANTYEIVFDGNGGAGSITNQEMTYDVAQRLTENSFTKTGYSFSGWNTESDGSGTKTYDDKELVENLVTDGEITLYAQWTPNSYTIVFDANSPVSSPVEGTMDDLLMTYDTPKDLPLNAFSVSDYDFSCWNTKSDGTGSTINNGDSVNNLAESGTVTLYAQWTEKEIKTYDITYNYGDVEFLGNNHLDTKVALFSENNFDRDFEIKFSIDDFTPLSGQDQNRNALVTCMDESVTDIYPGFVHRYLLDDSEFNFATYSTKTIKNKQTYNDVNDITISRINKEIFFNDISNLSFEDMAQRFDIPLVFGASIDKNQRLFRYFKGTLGDISLKLYYEEDDSFSLPKPTREGYTFTGWNTMPDGTGTDYDGNIQLDNDLSLYAMWRGNDDIVQQYSVTYDYGSIEFDRTNYLNTNIKLFSEDSYMKNFKISLNIDQATRKANQDTAISCMDESGTPYPGFVYRYGSNNNRELVVNVNSSDKYQDNELNITNINLSRTNNIMSLNGEQLISFEGLSKKFDVPVTIGSSLDRNGNPQRYFTGNISSINVTRDYDSDMPMTLPEPALTDCTFLGWTGSNGDTIEKNVTIPRNNTENKHYVAHFQYHENVVTFNPNGGTVEEDKRIVDGTSRIGTLPIPQKGGYIFDGWYTGINAGEKIDEDSILSGKITIYAHWKKTVGLLAVANQTITLAEGQTEDITISDINELGEDYTFISSNPSIASVNANGKVTANSEGETTIKIKGLSSNTTKTINVLVTNNPDVVLFNVTPPAVQTYFDNVATWNSSKDNFLQNMQSNFERHTLKLNNDSSLKYASGNVLGDKPNSFDTETSEKVNVYLYNESTGTKTLVNYAKADNGIIHNLIPGEMYYWESDSDSTKNGYIKVIGKRRLLDTGEIRNVRDLGGLPVDVDNDGVIDGTTKYEKIFRGERLWQHEENVAELQNLGITKEIAVYSSGEESNNVKLPNYVLKTIVHYDIDYNANRSNYNKARAAVVEAMNDVINGENIYFHCVYGSDRTGTLGYLLEGLLGVPDEDRYEDYELSVFYGEADRNRYYESDLKTTQKKFVYMKEIIETKEDIYEWFMKGSTNVEADRALINQFRDAMINFN